MNESELPLKVHGEYCSSALRASASFLFDSTRYDTYGIVFQIVFASLPFFVLFVMLVQDNGGFFWSLSFDFEAVFFFFCFVAFTVTEVAVETKPEKFRLVSLRVVLFI